MQVGHEHSALRKLNYANPSLSTWFLCNGRLFQVGGKGSGDVRNALG